MNLSLKDKEIRDREGCSYLLYLQTPMKGNEIVAGEHCCIVELGLDIELMEFW